jgi:nicotinamidase-related amidase
MNKLFSIFLLVVATIAFPAGMQGQTDSKEKVQAPAQKENFHLYLLIGQSNMAGRGIVEPQDTVGNTRILRLNKENEWEIARDPLHYDKANAGVGPGLSFARSMLMGNDNIVIGLIPCAVGGSAIDYWQPDVLYKSMQVCIYDEALKRARIAMKDGILKGILWHQGESDKEEEKAMVYKDKLIRLVSDLRKELQAPDVPFIAGEIPSFKNRDVYINPVFHEAKKNIPHYDVVSAQGLMVLPDSVHLNAASQREFGKRYAEKMKMSFTGMDVAKKPVEQPLRISMQQRTPAGTSAITCRIEDWNPSETAIIICDMWDRHWCRDATDRVAEIAPRMNETLNIAREKGIKIVHAPSNCMDFYKDYPGRIEAQKYNDPEIAALADGKSKLPSEENAVWPVDQSGGGCENPECKSANVWKRQIETLTIKDEDLITDSGAEAGSYFRDKGIKNVILVGVHTNMCIINRTFGLRAMKRMGMNAVLMRDMTDLMYDHAKWPYVDHFAGLDLMVEYIETYVCPSIVSSDFTGKKQFTFKGDKRSHVKLK